MAEGGDDSGSWWDATFDTPEPPTREQRNIGDLMRARERQEKEIAALRSDLKKTRGQIRQLKSATVSLLGPVMLGGIIGFAAALEQADGKWSKLAVFLTGAFAVWWLRDVGKSFDDVTRD